MTRPAQHRGFTLIEILLAAAIVAVLSGTLFACLYGALKARGTALGSVAGVRKAHQSVELIRADLQCAVIPTSQPAAAANSPTPPPLVLAGPFVGTSGQGMLAGGGDSLSFYSTVMDRQSDTGIGDIKLVQYACEPAADTGEPSLVRRESMDQLAVMAATPAPEIICRNIKSFTLQYYDGAAWQTAWDTTADTMKNSLPLAVMVTISLADEVGKSGETRPGATIQQVLPIPCGAGLVQPTSTSGGGL